MLFTSERLTTLQSYSSDNGGFIKATKTQQRVILANCEETIGSDLSTYTEELKEAIKKNMYYLVLPGCTRPMTSTFDHATVDKLSDARKES